MKMRCQSFLVLVFLILIAVSPFVGLVKAVGTVSVRGYCYYVDDYGVTHPIRYATVNLYDRTWLGIDNLLTDIYGNPCSTWTDGSGYYSFNPVSNVDELGGMGTLDLSIEVQCDSGAIKVVPSTVLVLPYNGFSSVNWDVPDGTMYISLTYNDAAKKGCWGIYDSILQAYITTENSLGYRIPKITAIWPWPETYFQDLWILKYIGIDNAHTWDEDAACHEYGHWVMDCLYGGYVPSVNYGSDGGHYWDSHEDAQTAWVEGWADFYSCWIRNDRYFWNYYDIESQSPKSDDVEGAIAGVLWDIADSSNDGRDTLSLGLAPIWDVMKNYVFGGNHAFTVHDFWDGLFARGYNYPQQLWAIYYDHGINKDTTYPSTPVPDDGVSGWSNDNTPEFSWNLASDSLSGVAGYYWKVDDGIETWTTGTSVTLPAQSDGSHTFFVKAVDNAGNLGASGSHVFRVDTSPPTGSVVINSGDDYANSTSVTLNLTYLDVASGVDEVRYSNDGVFDVEVWEPPSSSKPWTLLPDDGLKTVYFQVKDDVGNLATFSDTITLFTDGTFVEELFFNASVGEVDYVIGTCSNSTVSGFSFNQTLKQLRFGVDGTSGTTGFCNITVPSELMSGNFMLYMDDELLVEGWDYTKSYNGTHYLFGVTYTHSTHNIELLSTEVIPEFANWLFLPCLMAATLLGLALRRRLKK